MEILFWGALFFIYYIYDGYLRVLQLWPKNVLTSPVDEDYYPSVSVLLTVHNEQDGILEKIRNILGQNYPENKLEIIVASDGSTDQTDALVNSVNSPLVKLFLPSNRIGKTDTQNQAIDNAMGEIILFTDCDTRFGENFLKNITKPFYDVNIGCVTGCLLFSRDKESRISEGQGYYWEYELRLRRLESDLGVLAVASGACMAVRKTKLKKMEASYGEDCILPLDVILQGSRVVHQENAIAFDEMPSTTTEEFRTRVRMTLRNWQGTWSRKTLLNPVKYPYVSWVLTSHKILRWLSPFFLILVTLTSIWLAFDSRFFVLISICLLVFYLAGVVGYFSERGSIRLPLVGIVYSFLLANAGFLIGLLKVVRGQKVVNY